MKASEVLRRYAAGERDFRRTDLRGQSFKGQDLSGADLGEADIRGTNFSNAILKGVNFTGANAGVQKCWLVVQQAIALAVSVLSGLLSVFSGAIIAVLLFDSSPNRQGSLISGVLALGLMGTTFITVIRQGFTFRAFLTIAGAVASAVAGAFVVAGTFSGAGAVAAIFAFAVAGLVAGAGVGLVAVAVTFTGLVASTFGFAFVASFGVLPAGAGLVEFASAFAIVGTFAGITVLLSFYVVQQASNGDKKFALLRTISIVCGAVGGTSFCGADLTHSNFSKAILKSTNFNSTKQRQTILEWVCWQDVKKLDYARLGNSILSNPTVRELLVTRNGYKKSYMDANLREANLNGVDLKEANLKWADLSEATLHHADLRGADLSETLVLGADFTGASLTGACLEGWNIDHNTKLDRVDCQYVYLLHNQQERRPSSGDFASGEFTKLFQEVLSTVDLIFRNGIDWKAFAYSFNKLVLDNEGTELSIQSIENKGDGIVVVRVNAPPDADKARLHTQFNQTYETAVKALEAKYQAELQAKDDQITIYRQQSADMLEITRLMANRPINVQAIAEAKAMNESTDSSQSFNVGGNFNISATNSVVNLRDLSGTVTNAINQLPDEAEPGQPSLKELLTQLQTAIEADADLPDTDKADLLEQVQGLTEAKQTEEPAQREGLARKAKKMFEATLKGLPDTAKIAEATAKLLPMILKVLGVTV